MDLSHSIIKAPLLLEEISADYSGTVVISDIDKTYLATQIDSIGGLLKTAFETAEAKDTIPGFSIVLRALRRGGESEPQKVPLFFVSASPPQMRSTLQSKMEIDGVEHNGIIFKDQLTHVRNRAFGKLREQIGYKLEALLYLWAHLPNGIRLVLFGDDSESDPAIYTLFGDVLAGKVRGTLLADILEYLGVYPEESRRIQKLADGLGEKKFEPVDYAFINIVSGNNPAGLNRFGPRLFATDNSLQVGLTLFENGLIRERAVRSIGKELILHYDFGQQQLLESMKQGLVRGLFGWETLRRLWPMLAGASILPEPPEGELDQAEPPVASRLSRSHVDGVLRPYTFKELKVKYGGGSRFNR